MQTDTLKMDSCTHAQYYLRSGIHVWEESGTSADNQEKRRRPWSKRRMTRQRDR